MRFLADQDVWAYTLRTLREWGHDVISAVDVGLTRAPDSELLEEAHRRERILVTRDRDFGRLVFAGGKTAGVVLLRICTLYSGGRPRRAGAGSGETYPFRVAASLCGASKYHFHSGDSLTQRQPRRIFKLSENRAFDLLMEAETWEDPPFVYRDSAGNRQLLRQSEEVTAQTVLERYYASARDRVLA